MADPTCPTCGLPLEKTKSGQWSCPKCARRFCPRCGRVMQRKGDGYYVCPDGHGEWLEDELEPEVQQAKAADYEPDPYRHDKTIDSQIREYGPGSNGVGRRRKKPTVKRKPNFWKDV